MGTGGGITARAALLGVMLSLLARGRGFAPAGSLRSQRWRHLAASAGTGGGETSNILDEYQGYRVRDTDVDEVMIRGAPVLVKRDDQLRLLDSGVFGNKGRKLWWLNSRTEQQFPASLASFGGPQSNAMVALAAVADKYRRAAVARENATAAAGAAAGGGGSGSAESNAAAAASGSVRGENHPGEPSFHYFMKKLPRWLRSYPSGNFARAKALGMTIHELSPQDYKWYFGGKAGSAFKIPEELEKMVPRDTLWVPQGGAMFEAEPGLKILAQEIESYWAERGAANEKLTVAVPAGTGTTALYLARHLASESIRVVALSCCGPVSYTDAQVRALDRVTRAAGAPRAIPEVMGGAQNVPFGEPRAELLDIWYELQDAGVYCDLTYAPRAWQILFDNWEDPAFHGDGHRLMYVHTGGLEGVSTQLTRYRRAGFLKDESEPDLVTDDSSA